MLASHLFQMQKIVHISDIHFGRENKQTIQPIIRKINQLKPDLIIISGDLTQDGTPKQFKKARHFIKKLKFKKFVIPGNHDMPFLNVLTRFLIRFARYRKYISPNPEPSYQNSRLIVTGINTARPLFFKQGRISLHRIKQIAESFIINQDDRIKIIVSHHPLFLPKYFPKHDLVYRWKKALRVLDNCEIDLYLSGHHHSSSAVSAFKPKDTQSHYKAIAVQAGTAISKRTRKEQNSFNYLEIDQKHIRIDILRWSASTFHFSRQKSYKFKKTAAGWITT